MAKIKADILKNILDDGEKAKTIPGMRNRYTPDEYNKVITRDRVLSNMNQDGGGYLIPEHEVGSAEYDSRGNLVSLRRTAPAMLDLNIYCANRYYTEHRSVETEEDATTKDGNPVLDKNGNPRKKTVSAVDVVVVFGYAIIKAIEQRTELPNNITVYRFTKEKNGFKYVKAEMITPDKAYEMKSTLKNEDALKLMQLMQKSEVSTRVEGDSLDDIK